MLIKWLIKAFPVNHTTRLFRDFDGYKAKELYDILNEGGVTSDEVISSNQRDSGWDPAAVSLLVFARETIEYYKVNHTYDAVVANGSDLALAVNAGKSNASFYGGGLQLGQFGVGAGVFAGQGVSFARAKDVVGHEINHGVVSVTSGLEYKFESGALDESFSDFFGAVIENKNWLLGEDLLHPSGLTLRNMQNPANALRGGQPSHMSEFRELPNTADGDSGGVHVNSGIHNRALYLLAEGLTDEGLGISIGVAKAADLAFRTMIGLTQNATFDDSANLMYQNALAKYGQDSVESSAVVNAMQA